MGVGYKGPALRLLDDVVVRPTNLNGGDLVGAYEARLTWASLAADAVLALNDIWYLDHYSRELAAVVGTVPMVGYLPLDGDIPNPRIVEDLTGFHTLFTYTKHAAGELERALRTCGHPTPVRVAGHGVDVETFRPADGTRASGFDSRARMRLAQELFGLPEPAWVVLNASRPDPRKRIDLTLGGFAAFARGRPPHVRLCLHQAIAHPRFVEPLRQQAAALGIGDRILWWPPGGAPLDDRHLCALYNACAAGVNTSAG
jgi:glycosyltransferase involved in cell wall biosynthesis